MGKRYHEVMGEAYTDMLTTSTGKGLSEISEMLGFSKQFLSDVKRRNQISYNGAILIEKMFGISVSPYIVAKKPEAKDEGGTIDFDLDEFIEVIKISVCNYLRVKLEDAHENAESR